MWLSQSQCHAEHTTHHQTESLTFRYGIVSKVLLSMLSHLHSYHLLHSTDYLINIAFPESLCSHQCRKVIASIMASFAML